KGGLCQLGIEGKRTWGGRGVIWYCSGVLWCTGIAVGKGVFFGGNREIVPELWTLDKLSFTVRLFDENLLPDPAFLCGF
nr:hypothetical protein [Tanacetum cinerariifolium]